MIISRSLLCCVGDNMLTALSVARECSMIDINDTVINLTVLPPTDSRPPHIEYTYTDGKSPESVSRNKFMLWLF